ncbi:MAG: methyltransferase domain-containing protein [Bacteroidota bacterium]
MNNRPFDHIANQYDDQFTQTKVGLLQRERVYALLEDLMDRHSIQQVLEVNCGTGEDACWLAQKGKRVLATDQSATMIEVARQKAHNLVSEATGSPNFAVCNLEELAHLDLDWPADLLLSNFGGLNCLDATALQKWSEAAADKLRPGGFLAAIVMGRFCAWETLYFSLKGQWKQARRRQSQEAVQAPLAEGVHIPVWYYRPKQFAQFFSPQFDLQQIRPIGFALPPSYLDPFFQKRPALLNLLHRLEKGMANQAFWAGGADHFWLLLQKRA